MLMMSRFVAAVVSEALIRFGLLFNLVVHEILQYCPKSFSILFYQISVGLLQVIDRKS